MSFYARKETAILSAHFKSCPFFFIFFLILCTTNYIIMIGFLCLFFPTQILFITSSLQATIWQDKSRGRSISVGAGSFSWLILVNELHILQANSSAWILRTAIELYSNFRCRSSMNILIYHITDFNPRSLLKKNKITCIQLNFNHNNIYVITSTDL